MLRVDENIKLGRLLARLILNASDVSQIDLSEIQFNFCLQDTNGNPLISPSSREDILACIKNYLLDPSSQGDLTLDDRTRLTTNLKVLAEAFPDDPANLHDYARALQARGNSFHEAAALILDHSRLPPEIILAAKKKLAALKTALECQLEKLPATNEVQQARYDGYMKALTVFLVNNLDKDKKEITQYLKEAETIVNIKQRKAHITISGKISDGNGILYSDSIYLQIDEPRNRFKDLSNAQRDEWVKVYNESEKPEPHYPPWFQQRTDIEKRIWLARMALVMKHLPNPADSEICMGPVVKKQGIPGLRNLALSSFATVAIDVNGSVAANNISAKSIRSSNLIVQAKDGNRTLNENQKKLTMDNIFQVTDLYKRNNMNNNAGGFTYQEQREQPFVLCQSLLRKIGGGDDYVIRLKHEAVANINATLDSDKYFSSNHCIGAHAKISKAFHFVMHLTGANTKGMDHIIAPMNHFMEDAVKKKNDDITNQALDALYQSALQGRYEDSPDDLANDGKLNDIQRKTLDFILRATSMYARETKSKLSFNKKHQLHMAALEEVIYQDTGNYVQSSCKSGKDREAVEKTYRNAMRAFYAKYARLPPSGRESEEHDGDREKFVDIYLELFMTHHQARLAELNANGCLGLKALKNILPKDIYDALQNRNEELLKTHKLNSALNEIGHTAVKADPAELERLIADEYFNNHETFAGYNDKSFVTKSEGANNPGPHGGIYQRTDEKGYAIFKRDTTGNNIHYGKIIAEFTAGRLISNMLSEMHKKDDPEYGRKFTAEVNLVKATPRTAGETGDEKIYLQSIFLNQYAGDFWKTAFTSEQVRKLKNKPNATIPALLKLHQHEHIRIPSNKLLNNPILHADFCDQAATRIFVSDYGSHAGNIGTVKDHNDTRLGSFDYGAALKNLSSDFVIFSRLGTGTSIHKNHLLEYSDDVIKSEKMAESLIKIGDISDDFIKDQAKEILTSVNIPHSAYAIKQFCRHIGIDKSSYQQMKKADELLDLANNFIKDKLLARKLSANNQGYGLLLEHLARGSRKTDGSIDKPKLQQLIEHSPHREKLILFIRGELKNYSPVLPDTKLDTAVVWETIQSEQRIYPAEAVILENLLQGTATEDVEKKLQDYSNSERPGKLDIIRYINSDLDTFIKREQEIFDKLPARQKGAFPFASIKENLADIRAFAESLKNNAPATHPQNSQGFFKQLRQKLKHEITVKQLQNNRVNEVPSKKNPKNN